MFASLKQKTCGKRDKHMVFSSILYCIYVVLCPESGSAELSRKSDSSRIRVGFGCRTSGVGFRVSGFVFLVSVFGFPISASCLQLLWLWFVDAVCLRAAAPSERERRGSSQRLTDR